MALQPPKPGQSTRRIERAQSGSTASGASVPVGGLDRLIKRAVALESFGPEDLQAVNALLRGRLKDKQRDELQALLDHPKAELIFKENTREELRTLVATLAETKTAAASTPAPAPKRSTTKVKAGKVVTLGDMRLAPQPDGGVQVLYGQGLERRSVTVHSDGRSLTVAPHSTADDLDYCLLLYALGVEELSEVARDTAYQHLAFVDQRLAGSRLASLAFFYRDRRRRLPADFVERVKAGLARFDSDAASELTSYLQLAQVSA